MKYRRGLKGALVGEGWAKREKPSEGQTILRLQRKLPAGQQPTQECSLCPLAREEQGQGSSHMMPPSPAQDKPQSTIFSPR